MNGDITILSLENMCIIGEQNLSGHNDDICGLSFSWTKGQYSEGILSSVSRDGFVKVWDVIRKYNIADIKLDANKSKAKNWFSLAVLPNTDFNDSKFEVLIGCGNGEILTIEIPQRPPDSKIRVHKPTAFSKSKSLTHSSVIFSIAVDVKTKLAVTSSLDHQILVWDLNERKAINTFYTFSHGVHGISLSPIDPSRVAIAIGDGLHIINFDNNLNVMNQQRCQTTSKSRTIKNMTVVWHQEFENRLAYGTSIGEIVVLDLNSSQRSHKYFSKKSNNDSTKIYCLSWGPALEESQESTLYSLHQSGKIYLHYISSNRVIDFTNYITEATKRSEMMWKTNYKHFSVGNEDGTVDIFEHRDHALNLMIKINAFKKAILCLRWNSNKDEETSNWLAISSYESKILCYSLHNYLNTNDTDFQVKDFPHIVVKANCVLTGHSDRITSMSWCPSDSNKLVSVSYDQTAKVWDVSKQSLLINFCGHRGILYTVVWSAFDEDLIFSGGEDNYLHAWRPSKHIQTSTDSDVLVNSDDIWPQYNNTSDDETCVFNIIKDCVNRVAIDQQNGEYNGFNGEEKPKLKKQTKNKNKSLKKKLEKENKKCSLFPLSNCIEKSSTKYQKIEDIEALFNKLTGNEISEEQSERLLLYGDYDDLKKFIDNEVKHHLKQGNKEPKDIINLLFDIKATVEEAIEQKEMNPYLVSLSTSISRTHWKQSTNILTQYMLETDTELQTFKMYRQEMAAIFLIAQNKVREAIDLLLSNQLYRESLVVAKVKLQSNEMIEYIMTEWIKDRQSNNDFEGAAKCLTAIYKFNSAADLLNTRDDQQFNHTISLLRSFNK